MLHPDFPVIEGKYQMTDTWFVTLPEKFNRRIEDGDLVIWKPGFTIWISVWGNDPDLTFEEFYESTIRDISPESYDIKSEQAGDVKYFSYRLREEESDDERVPAFYCFAISPTGYVQAAMYFDNEQDSETGAEISRSFQHKNAS